MSIKIGAQYYTIRETCQTIEDFDASCKKVADIGYKYVQLSGIGNFEASEIKPIIDKYGLEVVCTHRPAVNYLENLDKEIEFHKTLGTKICGLGAMPDFNAKPETLKKFVENFTAVADKLAQNGLTFAYHNHAFEFEKTDGKYAFDIITEASTNFKFILDVYWLAFAGINPAKFIKKYADTIACVHFKDLKIVDNAPKYAEIGQGNLEWDEIITACEEVGVEYALVEQDICDGDPFDSLKISHDFLKSKGL